MSGARSAFSEIDFGVRGSVKFGDDSVVEIEGHGTIIFLGDTGKHRRLSEVYYIISLRQMEEGGGLSSSSMASCAFWMNVTDS
jgi:hypothetical protein